MSLAKSKSVSSKSSSPSPKVLNDVNRSHANVSAKLRGVILVLTNARAAFAVPFHQPAVSGRFAIDLNVVVKYGLLTA